MTWLTRLAIVASLFSSIAAQPNTFNPRHHHEQKKSVTCKAIKRDADHTVVDISLTYVDINPEAKTTIIMVHGWPSLWSSWSRQIEELQDDYHLIIPDLRGFGASTHPDDPKASGNIPDIVGDLACILGNESVASAICMGHDWGSAVCYEAGRSRPDLFHGIVGLVIPYLPAAGPFIDIKNLVSTFPKLTYQLYFDGMTSNAIDELNKDIRRTIRATLRTKASPPPNDYLKSAESFLAAYDHLDEIPPVPWFTPDEEDYFVEQYSIQGFKNTLQFYTRGNRHATWKFAHEQGNHTIPLPVLAVYPKQDPVADWSTLAIALKSHEFLPHVTTELVDGAHWVHLENPNPVNAAIKAWLKTHHRPKTHDEL